MANFIDALAVLILGLALLSGKVQGVQMGPLNICVGVSVIISSFLLLLEDIGVLAGKWSRSGWVLLVISLIVFVISNV